MAWFHGGDAPITRLKTEGSGMNLWGARGAYLTNDPVAAARFGPCLNRFDVATDNILNTDDALSDDAVDVLFDAYNHFNVPATTYAYADIESYGDVIAFLGDYAKGGRTAAVAFLREKMGFDALLTPAVSGHKNGVGFSEGDILVVLDATIATAVSHDYVRVPEHVVFHGSAQAEPIADFKHGVVPAVAGFAGMGTVEVARSGFFFSEDPRMAQQFGHAHAYALPKGKSLDLRNDLLEHDAQALRDAGFSVEGMDGKHCKWELFDGEEGRDFVDNLIAMGYEKVRYFEEDHDGVLRDCVVGLDARKITPAPLPEKLINHHAHVLGVIDDITQTYQDYREALTGEQLVEKLAAVCKVNGLVLSNDEEVQLPRLLALGKNENLRDLLITANPFVDNTVMMSMDNRRRPATAPSDDAPRYSR